MSSPASAGARFRAALAAEKPLQVIGAINANHALLAQRAGYKAIYLSGGGVAAGSLGVPDLGITGLEDVLIDVRRITDVCDTPLLVDVDTGFGSGQTFLAAWAAWRRRRGSFRRWCSRRPGRRHRSCTGSRRRRPSGC